MYHKDGILKTLGALVKPSEPCWFFSPDDGYLFKKEGDETWLKLGPVNQSRCPGYFDIIGTNPPVFQVFPAHVSKYNSLFVCWGFCNTLEPPFPSTYYTTSVY